LLSILANRRKRCK